MIFRTIPITPYRIGLITTPLSKLLNHPTPSSISAPNLHSPVSPQRPPELLQPLLQNPATILKKSPLLRHLLRLGSNVRHLALHHVVGDEWREGLRGEIVEEVALDDLVGDGGDEVLTLSCFAVNRGPTNEM